MWKCRFNFALRIFTCAYLSYDEFVHVNVKALPRGRVVRLLTRGKSHMAFTDSARKQGTI
jgi:hypothetical protein